MPIIFPAPGSQNPVNTFSPTSTPDATTNGLTYIWNPTLGVWTSSTGGGATLTSALGVNITGSLVKVSIPTLAAAPAPGALANEAIDGSLYWDTNTGALFIRYNDGTLTSWIQTVPSGGGGGGATAASLIEAAAGTINTKYLSPETGVPKNAAGMTGAAIIPGGDDTDRTAISPVTGMFRYNDQTAPAVMEYYDGSQWVDLATGGGGGIGSWEVVSTRGSGRDWNTSGQGSTMAWGNGIYVAVGSGGISVVSTDDGYTWSTPITPFAAIPYGIEYINNLFVVWIGGASRKTYVSPDGVNWTTGAAIPEDFQTIGGAGGNFIAAGNTRFFTSTDGLNWTAGTLYNTLTGNPTVYAIAAKDANEFVALGIDGFNQPYSVKTTNGGANWVSTLQVGSTATNIGIDIIWTGTEYLMVGVSGAGAVSSSADGVSLTLRFSAGSSGASMVNVANTKFAQGGSYIVLSLRQGPSLFLYGSKDAFLTASTTVTPIGHVATSGTTIVTPMGNGGSFSVAKVS